MKLLRNRVVLAILFASLPLTAQGWRTGED